MEYEIEVLRRIDNNLKNISESAHSIAKSLHKLANPMMNIAKDGSVTPADDRYLTCSKALRCGELCRKVQFMKCTGYSKVEEPSDE